MVVSAAMPVIFPGVPSSMDASGCPRFAWLNALNDSALNCSLNRSVIAKVLAKAKSALKRCGPYNELRPTSPNDLHAGSCQGPDVIPGEVGHTFVADLAGFVSLVLATVNQLFTPKPVSTGPTIFGLHGPVSRS